MAEDVFILDGVRTRSGRHGGALSGVRPDDLAATVVAALPERTPQLDPAAIDDVFFGNSNGAGEENRDFRLVSPQLREGTQQHVQSLVKIERSKKTDDGPSEQTKPGSQITVGRTGPGEGEAVDRVRHDRDLFARDPAGDHVAR